MEQAQLDTGTIAQVLEPAVCGDYPVTRTTGQGLPVNPLPFGARIRPQLIWVVGRGRHFLWFAFPMQPDMDRRAGIASELCEKGLWREMLVFARQWREEDVADYRAYYFLGLSWTGLRKFSQAEAAYRHALALNPNDSEVWNSLAELLYRHLRRQADGIQCLEKVMTINPHDKLGWLNLARLNGRIGRHERALQCANHALALDRKLVEAHLSKAAAARALGKTDTIREICCELATIELEHFRRAP